MVIRAIKPKSKVHYARVYGIFSNGMFVKLKMKMAAHICSNFLTGTSTISYKVKKKFTNLGINLIFVRPNLVNKTS